MGQIPVGTITSWVATVGQGAAPPVGWLLCDGSAVSRSIYRVLFSSIGTLYGEGDGKTTFNLPDYRGRFLRGVDDNAGRDQKGEDRSATNLGGTPGAAVGTVQQYYTALPVNPFITSTDPGHTHTIDHLPVDKSWYEIAGSHYAAWTEASGNTSSDGAHGHALRSADTESRPINLYFNFMIYTG